MLPLRFSGRVLPSLGCSSLGEQESQQQPLWFFFFLGPSRDLRRKLPCKGEDKLSWGASHGGKRRVASWPCPGCVVLVATLSEDSLLCLRVGRGTHGAIKECSIKDTSPWPWPYCCNRAWDDEDSTDQSIMGLDSFGTWRAREEWKEGLWLCALLRIRLADLLDPSGWYKHGKVSLLT